MTQAENQESSQLLARMIEAKQLSVMDAETLAQEVRRGSTPSNARAARHPCGATLRKPLTATSIGDSALRRERGTEESNLALRFWRPPCYRYTSPPGVGIVGAGTQPGSRMMHEHGRDA